MDTSRRPVAARALVVLGLLVALAVPAGHAAAAPVSSGGFTTTGRVSAGQIGRGSQLTITVGVTAAATRSALVDVEIHGNGGKVAQRFWDNQAFTAGVARTFRMTWTVPANQPLGTYRVAVGVFRVGWAELFHWSSSSASFAVTAGTTTTTTTVPPVTTPPPTTTTTTTTTVVSTTSAPTTAPPTTAAPSGRFVTLPPGSPLPSDAECASRVRPAAEIREVNRVPNATRGAPSGASGLLGRVTGNFTGTTDEIIQWAACKWGFDEDIIRAQTAKESWWLQSAMGDRTTDPSGCAPGHEIGKDGFPGECPESFGVQQVRYPYWGWAFPHAITSTAHNLDAALAARRSCYEGNEVWLNQFERGRDYVGGDLWGCVGLWFSGRWYTPAAESYIQEVKDYLAQRIWTRPEFIAFQG